MTLNHWPMVDDGLLGASGRISKRALKAAQKRFHDELFRESLKIELAQPAEKEADLRRAKTLRELASRGMKPRAYLREALKLEAKWA